MFRQRLDELSGVIDRCVYTTSQGEVSASEALKMFHFLLEQVTQVEGIVYVIGNGGSAGIASHFCTDLLRTLQISAMTFSDSNILTCFANDFGYENVYKMPLMCNLRSRDLLVAISSSGSSQNIVEACQVARDKKAGLITLSGFEPDNALRGLGELNFWLESADYGLVETGHFFLLHTIVDTCKTKSKRLATSAV
ncbi:MAG: Phosphoheptose isomerase [Chlamydiales bacterium]|nr:Phosphoheptose isomerase [Chlamydiales bacterium]